MATTTQLKHAKNLSREAPRSPRQRLGGYVIMARMIDKCRATIAGTNGEYHFDCPVDNILFGFKGVHGADVKQLLASGAGDDQVVEWFNTHGTPRDLAEIKAWSDKTEATQYHNNPEKKEWFIGECKRLGLEPTRTSLFDYLDEDDRQSFKKNAPA